jgi:long-chain acyl-CoA synthetase
MYTWDREIVKDVEYISYNGNRVKSYINRPKHILDMFWKNVTNYPEKDALIYEDQHLTYSELDKQSELLAKYLVNRYEIKCGDRVALLMKNTATFCVSTIAILKLGAIVVPLSTKLHLREWKVLFEQADVSLILGEDSFFTLIKSDNNFQIPFLKESDFQDISSDFQEIPELIISENDPAFIMFTSGTTGLPKGAVLTHFNVIHASINYERCYELTAEDKTVIAVPIFHGTGLFAQFMTFLYLGGTSILLNTYNTKQLLLQSEKHNVTHLMAVPTIYSMLLDEMAQNSYKVNFNIVGTGGAIIPDVLLERLMETFPNSKIINTYGLTEATSPAIITPYQMAKRKRGSIGIPSPVTDVKIIDLDTGDELPANHAGELCLKGAITINEYWNNKLATKNNIVQGWLKTGDVAVRDEDGFIYLKDRIKNMINRGGEKIYSSEIEDVLYRHPKIRDVAVVGEKHELYGEVVKAVIVTKENETITPEEIKEWALQSLAKYKVPHTVKFVKELPFNASGKVIKSNL